MKSQDHKWLEAGLPSLLQDNVIVTAEFSGDGRKMPVLFRNTLLR